MKSDFLVIYQALEKKDRHAFLHFLKCFYSTQKIALRAIQFIEDQLSMGRELNMEKLFSHSFEQERFDNQFAKKKYISNLFSDLKIYVQEFIVWKEMKSQPEKSSKIMVQWLQRNGLNAIERKVVKNVSKTFESYEHSSFLELISALEFQHYLYVNAPENTLPSSKDTLLKNIIDLRELFNVVSKIIYLCEYLSNLKVLGDMHEPYYNDVDINNLYEIINTWSESNETIRIYSMILRMLTQNDINAYLDLKSQVLNLNLENKSNLNAAINFCQNFAAGLLREARTPEDSLTYKLDLFNLYRVGLKKNALLSNGIMPHQTFQNIVNLGCALNRIEWVQEFVRDWGGFLASNGLDNNEIIKLAQSRIQFTLKNYEKALDLIPYGISAPAYQIQSRILEIMCFYELKSELLDYKIEAFSLYLYRLKRSQSQLVVSAKNFLKIIRITSNTSSREGSKMHLLSKLDKSAPIVFQDWLREKILEKK